MAGESPDLFRILISTDNHLGYLSTNETRGKDSFLAFEEVLETARARKVDFLLLGGDLFHEHSPSNDTLHQTLKMLNHYCLGTYAIQFATDDSWLAPNYLNEHLSVSLPVFIIHGNHDEPSAASNVSALDLVAISHFVNYFGKPTFVGDRLVVKPIRLRKGRTTLLLYGIGHMKDELLHRLFRQQLIDFEPPEESAFAILILHQNRFKGHGVSAPAKNCIVDSMIPEFVHFVLWGHEHDCYTVVRQPEGKDCHIYQPGSSVATSLTEGEAIPKHMGLLEVKCGGYRLTPIPYTCVRSLIYLQVEIREGQFASEVQAEKYLAELIDAEIRKQPQRTRAELALPLVRLKVSTDETELVNPIRIGTKLAGRIANQDIVLVHKRADRVSQSESPDLDLNLEKPEHTGTQYIVNLLKEELENHRSEFKLSRIDSLMERLVRIVDAHDTRALEEYFQEVQDKETAAEPRTEVQRSAELIPSGTDVETPTPAGQKRPRDISSLPSPSRQRVKNVSSSLHLRSAP